MKVILSEEQIKKLFSKRPLNEEEENPLPSTSMANTEYDPANRIAQATDKIHSYLNAIGGSSYAWGNRDDNGEGQEDPMPNGPIAYAYEKRAKYNNSIGVNSSWLRVVQQTYNDFNGPLFHGKYNQNGFKKYNGSTARADCTGFICAALRNAGYKVPNNNSRGMVGGSSFTNQISGGFTRVNWNKNAYGTINGKPLPAGTILCYPGHGMIVGEYNPSTKKLKGYDYGHNNHDENHPANMGKIYTVAWIPKVGGNV